MIVNVIRDFYDKYTGKYNPVGTVIDVSAERYEELEKAGNFVVKVADEPAEPVQANIEQAEPTEAETNDTAATEAPVEAADEPAEPPKKTSRRTKKK